MKILFTADKYGEMDILISENYFIQTASETAIILSFGGRSIIKKAGLDYGLIIPIIGGMDQFLALPWLGITIPFGNK